MKRIVGIILAGIGIITVISGFLFKTAGQTSVAVIGSADGPTSIFIAGKVRILRERFLGGLLQQFHDLLIDFC